MLSLPASLRIWLCSHPADMRRSFDGLAEMVNALREKRQPLHSLEHDIHLLDVIEASTRAAKEKRAIAVQSRFRPLDLRLKERQDRHHLHDHTRPPDEQ